MKIEVVIGMGKKTFLPHLKEKFGLKDYHPGYHHRTPLIVFGCGNQMRKKRVMEHKGLIVIVWTGSDTLNLQENPEFVEYLKEHEGRVFSLTFSHWCKTDLDYFGIKYQHRLIIPTIMDNFRYSPETKDKVYHYGSVNKLWYYGTNLLKEIERKWDAYQIRVNPEFIYTTYHSYNTADLQGLYKDSILGVRLTEHDGIAGSVMELGLMGSRTIYNDPQVPCAIPYMKNPYTTYNPGVKHKWCYQKGDLVQIVGDLIQKELDERPIPDKILAEEMKEFVYDDLAWLDTKFYTG